jgi:hypothetical protein
LGGLARPAPACLRHHLLPESRYVIVKRSLKGQGPPDLGGYACVLASEFSTGAPPRLVVNRQGAGGGPDDWNWPLFGSPFPDSMCSLCGIVRAFRADGAMGAGAGKWGTPGRLAGKWRPVTPALVRDFPGNVRGSAVVSQPCPADARRRTW